MLVSSIAQFDAVNNKNNAVYANMQTANAMLGTINNAHIYGGENNLAFLHSLDNRFSLEILKNNLMYKIACLQERMASKVNSSAHETKKGIDYLA